MLQANSQQHDALSNKSEAFSETHIAVLDEAVAAFALRCKLIIWHSTRGRDIPHGKLLITAHGDQGLIIERIEVDSQIAALHWLTPVLPCQMFCRTQLGTAMLVVLTSCGVLHLFDTGGRKLYMQNLSLSKITDNVATTVLSSHSLSIKTNSSIVSIPAAEFAVAAENFRHPNDKGRPGVGRHDHGCVCVRTINLPEQLARHTGAVCLEANISVLMELLECGTTGHEDTKVLSIGEGPAISWLSCGYDLTGSGHNHQCVEESEHGGNQQLHDMTTAQHILGVTCKPESLWASFQILGPTAADVVGVIAGLSCLYVCHHHRMLIVNTREGSNPEFATDWPLHVDDRCMGSLCVAPDQLLAACTDDKGRVLLVDTTINCIVRIWKGRRDAQLGWLVASMEYLNKTETVSDLVTWGIKSPGPSLHSGSHR